MKRKTLRVVACVLVATTACDPYARWPEAESVFPWVYTPLEDLQPFEEVRFETETWVPLVDIAETALYVQKSLEHRKGAPLEVQMHFGTARPPGLDEDHPHLSFAGDIMPMTRPVDGFAAEVAPLLDGVLRVGNLETPVSTLHPTDRDEVVNEFGLFAFNAPVSLVEGLPFDVLQLNNNHSFDLGGEGFASTAANVAEAGFEPLGHLRNDHISDLGDGVVVGFLAYTWGSNAPVPDGEDLFVVPFGRLDQPIELERVADDVLAIRAAGATHVVLMLHWGFEYEYWPDPHFMVLARRNGGGRCRRDRRARTSHAAAGRTLLGGSAARRTRDRSMLGPDR